MSQSILKCLSCENTYPIEENIYTCPACDGLLDVVHDLAAWHGKGEALRQTFDARLSS